MFTLASILTAVLFALRTRRIMNMDESVHVKKEMTNGKTWGCDHLWDYFIDTYGLPFGQSCISFLYGIYTRFTFLNMIIFCIKYIPSGFYMFKFMRTFYRNSRERIKQKQIELEDIQLQIQIVNTKLCVRDAEFMERAEQLRRGAERWRQVRARVRETIAADEGLRRTLDSAGIWDNSVDLMNSTEQSTPEEERDYMLQLLKYMKYDQMATPERQTENMDCGEHAQTEPIPSEQSFYSSLSDVDAKQDCRVKIIKVTNVYKVAYMKHYIKQKRLRRATKHALLKKKMESIKKLLEDWQKTLNMVINSKVSILNMDTHPIDVTSQEAMGDYSKPNLRESSDSDTDLRNSDTYYDDYSLSWTHPYRYCPYSSEEMQDNSAGEYYESQDYIEGKYQPHKIHQCECNGPKGSNVLFILPEETSSQVAIEELKSEAGEDNVCHDLVVL